MSIAGVALVAALRQPRGLPLSLLWRSTGPWNRYSLTQRRLYAVILWCKFAATTSNTTSQCLFILSRFRFQWIIN